MDERLKIVVLVKAAPVMTSQLEETMCVAGARTELIPTSLSGSDCTQSRSETWTTTASLSSTKRFRWAFVGPVLTGVQSRGVPSTGRSCPARRWELTTDGLSDVSSFVA